MVQNANADDQGRVLERKREILIAASHAFREHGFHATGMRDIASALGMTVGNLYYYFKNKEELLAFCQEDALAGLQALVAATERLEGGAEDKLRHLIVGHVELLNEKTPGSLAHRVIAVTVSTGLGVR